VTRNCKYCTAGILPAVFFIGTVIQKCKEVPMPSWRSGILLRVEKGCKENSLAFSNEHSIKSGDSNRAV
jgi:hypothetical protein